MSRYTLYINLDEIIYNSGGSKGGPGGEQAPPKILPAPPPYCPTMLDDRLGDLASLSINRMRAKEFEMDSIVFTFGKQHRRIVLF